MVEEFESIQLALFTSAPPALDAIKFWDAIFGTSPTGFQTIAPGHTQAQGPVNDLDVIVIVQSNRFDIIVQALAPPPPAMPPAPITDINKAMSDSLSYAEKAIPHLAVGRTAAVIQGNSFAASSSDAVAKFSQALPEFKVPTGATGVTYEFIVPKPSKLNPNRRLTRLCRWQTVQSQFFNVGPGQMQVAHRFASHSYVDVYVEAMEAMSPSDAIAALQEVIEEAKSIVDGGPNAVG
jgi:hypothetical protein